MDYNARWYGQGIGRFVSPDNVVPWAGNPQALNRYSYVLNNPIVLTDPTGNLPICRVRDNVPCDRERPSDYNISPTQYRRSASYYNSTPILDFELIPIPTVLLTPGHPSGGLGSPAATPTPERQDPIQQDLEQTSVPQSSVVILQNLTTGQRTPYPPGFEPFPSWDQHKVDWFAVGLNAFGLIPGAPGGRILKNFTNDDLDVIQDIADIIGIMLTLSEVEGRDIRNISDEQIASIVLDLFSMTPPGVVIDIYDIAGELYMGYR